MKDLSFLKSLALLTQLGFSMCLPIVLGVWIGNYLDSRFETGFIFLIVFIVLGVGAGFTGIYHIVNSQIKKK